jgi:cell division protein FtsZ
VLDEKIIETPKEEVKQITIIDEIQNNEPFVFVKEEKVEEQEFNVTQTSTFDNSTFELSEAEVSSVNEKTETSFIIHQLNDEEKNDASVEVTETKTTITEFTFNDIKDEAKTAVSETTSNNAVNSTEDTISREEQIKLAQERIRKLKEITLKMKSPEGLAALEKQTAFERKNISLENKTHSTESNVSRFTLTETEDKKIEIRPNNSFLHDNVD